MIPPFILSLIPVAVSLAEKLFGGSKEKGPEKKEYVWGLVDDLWDLAAVHMPAEYQDGGAMHDMIVGLIDNAIEAAVKSMKKKKLPEEAPEKKKGLLGKLSG